MSTDEKVVAMKKLWRDLASNEVVTERLKMRNGKHVNVGFVNQFALHDFIPNKWFDWERRVNSEIMIIGQDWGPYKALLPYIDSYEREKQKNDFDYDEFLFRTFSSRTEKFIMKTLESTYYEKFGKPISKEIWDKFLFTVAVFFTRQGNHFRGSEFYDEAFGLDQSLPYLRRQIEIVKPKIVVPLGGAAWKQVLKIYKLKNYPEKISDVIAKEVNGRIQVGNTVIIPNFHPASHTDPKIQIAIWKNIWQNRI